DSFFEMDNPRRDVTWADSEMSIPFKSPGNLTIQNWLTLNIQDEWKIKGWQLKLAFTDSPAGNPSTTRVEFVAGTTPHVNGIGGSVITMDANLPLEEYNSRWTIRHEYGHVLGFPDCYAEFYDEDLGQMISYQLDVSNLMCSRRGHLQYQHYERLKATYSSKN
ncbi:MAG: hypothetical protein NTV34_08525, partial [Proteobacteria bacterium]|nr:hypothetical protein [Pseudomonadota bacterium]